MKYAKDVLWATLQNVAHRSGLLHQRRFDPKQPAGGKAQLDMKLGYASSHTYAIGAVPDGARVLDLGSEPQGGVARELAKKGCDVTVVASDPRPTPGARVKVFAQDLNAPPKYDPKEYDVLLLLDVIEHLAEPEKFLEELRKKFDHEPKRLVLTTPNIAFVIPRLMLLAGQFNYGREGILARSHTRLFTFRSMRHLLRDAGFRIKTVKGVPAPFPKALGDGLLGRAAVAANVALIRVSKTLFAYQVYIEADSTPDVDFIAQDTALRSGQRHAAIQGDGHAPEPSGVRSVGSSVRKTGTSD